MRGARAFLGPTADRALQPGLIRSVHHHRMEREPIDWMPREYRRKVSIAGLATDAAGRRLRLLVTNISYAGCQVLVDQPLRRGETLHLVLPNRGQVTGQVRWVSGGKCGLRFLGGISSRDERRARIGV